MEELRQELFQKLRDLDEFVEANAKDLLGESHLKDKAENYKTLDQKDARVAERLDALAAMPVWLESMQKSLQEFSEIAKFFLPVKNGE
jgi:predicted translin family RNA/ssDNA-binding protein